MAEPVGGRVTTLPLDVTDATTAGETRKYAASSRRHYRESDNGFQAVDAVDAPLHLPLGPVAHAIAQRELASFHGDVGARHGITIATDVDQR